MSTRKRAIPEVAPHAVLVEPESPETLAVGIESLYRSPEARAAQAAAAATWVEQFDAPRVDRLFLEAARVRQSSDSTILVFEVPQQLHREEATDRRDHRQILGMIRSKLQQNGSPPQRWPGW